MVVVKPLIILFSAAEQMQDLSSTTQEALLKLTSCMMTSFAGEQEATILRITVI